MLGVLSLRFFLPALVLTVLTGLLFVAIAWKLLRDSLHPLAAAAIVALVLVPCLEASGRYSHYSTRELVIAVMFAMGRVTRALPARFHRLTFVCLSVLAGLALLVKFSNGSLAIVTMVLAGSLCSHDHWSSRVRAATTALLAATGAVVVFWLLAGQNPLNIPTWFRYSLELTSGYPEAMAVELLAVGFNTSPSCSCSLSSVCKFRGCA